MHQLVAMEKPQSQLNVERFKARQAENEEVRSLPLNFAELQIKWWPEERERAISTRYRVRYVIYHPSDRKGTLRAFFSDVEGPDARDAIDMVESFHQTDLEDDGTKMLILGVEWLGNAGRE